MTIDLWRTAYKQLYVSLRHNELNICNYVNKTFWQILHFYEAFVSRLFVNKYL